MTSKNNEVLAYRLIMAVASGDPDDVIDALDDIPHDNFMEVAVELASAVVKVYGARGSSVLEDIEVDFLFLLDKPES